jgi:hypothetical protein
MAAAEEEVFDALDAAERGLNASAAAGSGDEDEYQFESITRKSGRANRNVGKVCVVAIVWRGNNRCSFAL